MNLGYRIKYWVHKLLLTYLGPAQLGSADDPIRRLERERDEILGPRKVKERKPYIPKRHFASAGHH